MFASERVLRLLSQDESCFAVSFADDLVSFVKCYAAHSYLHDWNTELTRALPRPTTTTSFVVQADWSSKLWTNFVDGASTSSMRQQNITKLIRLATDGDHDGLRSALAPYKIEVSK